MHRFIIALVVLTASCLFALSETEQNAPFDVSYAQSGIQWSVFVASSGSVLTVSGPNGCYWRREYEPNSRPSFAVTDEQRVPRPEGLYRWELVAQLPPGPGGEVPDEPNPVVSGSFVISAGTIIPKPDDAQPAMVEEGASLRSLFLDRDGRLGMGTTVPQSQLHLKGSTPALTLEDTTTGGGLFTLRGLRKGDGSFGLFDQAGKPRWLVDREGRIGINTTKVTSTLTVDGYIETTKGFLVNGRPIGGIGFGLIGGSQPLSVEGASNNFFGTGAGAANPTGEGNSFFGGNAGQSTTTGYYNSFFGASAGQSNTIGAYNSFFGRDAGHYNTTGQNNSFFGASAGLNTTTGSDNSFFGLLAGAGNMTGCCNSFFGVNSGQSNTSGTNNTFFGKATGFKNTSGYSNTFLGFFSGSENTTGNSNSFLGVVAGYHNTVENLNTFIGYSADLNPGADPGTNPVTNATAIGSNAYVAQSNSLVLGSIAGVNGGPAYVNVGIGTTAPARQLHLAGPNAVFRMDRTTDTASFIMVRTDPTGATPWKTFVVGTNATGENQGEFIINDIGTAVGGGGNRRMTISNEGDVTFTGNVYATSFTPTSSLAFKTNIRTLENALATVNRLRGVRFDWKESGKPAVGLIAEEVNEVVPEVVALEGGKARGVNYDNLVAVLVEAVKEQQAEVASLKAEVEKLKGLLKGN